MKNLPALLFCIHQKPEKGKLRVHHINNLNRALAVLENNYNVCRERDREGGKREREREREKEREKEREREGEREGDKRRERGRERERERERERVIVCVIYHN